VGITSSYAGNDPSVSLKKNISESVCTTPIFWLNPMETVSVCTRDSILFITFPEIRDIFGKSSGTEVCIEEYASLRRSVATNRSSSSRFSHAILCAI